jgi:Aspartate carbamoyltransferase, catalytic chain
MKLSRKDILSIEYLSVEEINLILDTAESFIEVSTREIKKVPTLRGKQLLIFSLNRAPEREHPLKLRQRGSAPIQSVSPPPQAVW